MFSLLLATGDEGAGIILSVLLLVIAPLVGVLSRSRTIARFCAGIVGIIVVLLAIRMPWDTTTGIVELIAIAIALALFFSKPKGRSQ